MESVLEEKMGEVNALLKTTQEELETANAKNETIQDELSNKIIQLKEQQAFASSSSELTKELEQQQKAIFVQEEKFKSRIMILKKQLEVAERKVMNAKYLVESHERLSAEPR